MDNENTPADKYKWLYLGTELAFDPVEVVI